MNLPSVYVKLSSHDALSSSQSNANFKIAIDHERLNNVKAIRVKSCVFRNTFNNITKHNNTFKFTLSPSTELSFQIPVGRYTSTTLNTLPLLVQAGIEAADPSLVGSTVEYDDATSKIVITTPQPIKFEPNIRGRVESNPLSEILGFSIYDDTYTTFNTTHSATGYTRMYGPLTLNIYSRVLSNNSWLDGDASGSLDILKSIPIDVAFGATEHFMSDSEADIIKYATPRNLNTIDIRLRNNKGFLLDEYEDPVSIVLECFYN